MDYTVLISIDIESATDAGTTKDKSGMGNDLHSTNDKIEYEGEIDDSEDEPKDYDSESETLEDEPQYGPEIHRGIPKTPEAHDSEIETVTSTPEDKQESKEGENVPETRQSSRISKLVEKGISAGKAFFMKVGDYIKPNEIKETFKASIVLPHGGGPKTYCRLIRYKPKSLQLNSDLKITLTIKPSTRHCHHEDTHLFMRFIQ